MTAASTCGDRELQAVASSARKASKDVRNVMGRKMALTPDSASLIMAE